MAMGTVADELGAQEDYSGKHFIGTVVDCDDPLGLDRVKATIPNIYDDEASAPWIGPVKDSPFGCGTSGVLTGIEGAVVAPYGTFGPPQLGSLICVILQDGDPSHPMYLGHFLMGKGKSADQKKKFHNQAWGFADPTGNELLVDMKSKEMTFTHSSKVVIHIKDGTLTVTTPQDVNVIANGNVNAQVAGSMNAQVSGSTTLQSGGETFVTAAAIHLNGG